MKTPLAATFALLAACSASSFAGCNGSADGAPAQDPEAIEVTSVAAAESWHPGGRWVASWGAAPMPPDTAFDLPRSFANQTIRHVLNVSAGGKQVRVRLSNAFGAQPLKVGGTHVAVHGEGPAIVPGTDRTLTFGGKASVTIPPGGDALSDPVGLKVASHSGLAVSVYVPVDTGFATYHESSSQTSYISAPGDFAGATQLPVAEETVSRFFLSAVEVKTPAEVPTLVAIGDSITEGFGSTIDANRRWTDFLSARFNPPSGPARLAVVNHGVGCNRLLHDICGQNGVDRFERDVLSVTGATHVVVALGINDIMLPGLVNPPLEFVSADEIIAGLRQLADRAHADDLAVFGATLMPIGSSAIPGVFTPENEAKRQAVNQWVRAGHAFDAVIDFEATMRDPGQPDRLLPAYDSGDGIHPNDAGYEAMADSIDASLFGCH